MKSMMMTTAIKQAKDGKFEFINDIRVGQNEIRYQTPSGRWLHNNIIIIKDDRYTAKRKFWVYRITDNNPDTAYRMRSFEDTSIGHKAALEWKDTLERDPEAKEFNYTYCVVYE